MAQRFAHILLMLFCLSIPSLAQFAAHGQAEPQRRSDQEENMRREQQKKMNKQRHENIKKDTDKLLELSTQLKQYVDQSNENLLSIDVVRKAEEIEKLARSVKDKMKSY